MSALSFFSRWVSQFDGREIRHFLTGTINILPPSKMGSPENIEAGDQEQSVSMATGKSSVLDDRERPTSVMSTSSDSPDATAAVRNQQQSLATEILGPNHHLVFSSASSQVSDDEDVRNLGRLSVVSGMSKNLVRSTSTRMNSKPLPSPPKTQIVRSTSLSSGIEKRLSQSDAVLSNREPPSKTSVLSAKRDIRSHRVSMFLEDLEGATVARNDEKPATSGQISRNAATTIDWPLPTPTGSPVPGRRFDDLPGMLSPMSSEKPNMAAGREQQTPTPTATIISPQARKGPRTNFLPKFLRSKSPEAGQSGKPISEKRSTKGQVASRQGILEDATVQKPAVEAVSPKSFFDDESSDGDGEDSQIESAQQAIVAMPVMVKHGSTTRVGLKEMLRSTPPILEDQPGSSRDRIAGFGQNADPRTGSARNIYQHQAAEASKDGSLGAGLWKEINPFNASAPASKSSAQHLTPIPTPSPAPPKPSRKVSFPSPPPLQVKPEHRFLRQSVISTPYPEDQDGQTRQIHRPSIAQPSEPQNINGRESIVTLVSYSHGNGPTRVKKVVIPHAHNIAQSRRAEKGNPSNKAETARDFDDEKLFKAIKKEYAGIRSPFKQFASARSVWNIKLLSYHSRSHLVSRHVKPVHFHVEELEDRLAESRLMSLYQSPKRGKKHHEWTQWIRAQPENLEEADILDMDKLALEIVEGWSPTKLCLAFLTVFVCSLLAMLLWIFLGKGERITPSANAFSVLGQLNAGKTGYRGASSRVGTGAVLGLFVLLLGWAGIMVWVLLSWLVM